MDEHTRRIWAVGALAHEGGQWQVTHARELSNDQFTELQRRTLFITDLVSQEDFGRVVDAVARWQRLVQLARDELMRDDRVSRETGDAVALDLPAVVHAADRLETGMAERVRDAGEVPGDALRAFADVRHSIRASAPYLLTHELARRSASSGVDLVLTGNAVYFDSTTRDTALGIPVGLLGKLHFLLIAYLNVFEARIQEVAAELEELATAVPAGTPSLLSYEIEPTDGRPKRVSFTHVPLGEIAAIREFFHRTKAANRPDDVANAVMALRAATSRIAVSMGDIALSGGVVSSGAGAGVNLLPTAHLKIDLALLGSTPLTIGARYATPYRNLRSTRNCSSVPCSRLT